ncbi:hypothetical protein [Pseudoxanthomonas spadix]|uniref:hypothetical protein n=1 Tax=Pseudoxanthomonas spadix TaxID=415229 RepID=UPI0005B9F4A6|nr:hypothetical protein [Pseudoxanthomonas spadix]MBP3974006.1 hypothetical protein [Pseudoxanthomonas spadix]RMW95179.1 hypothetical protein D9R12_09690 [Pseudoxanthomonas spadix]
MAHRPRDVHAACPADPCLELVLRTLALTGLSLVLLLPGGRGSTELLGWTPLWLAGLPLVAWWSLHRFRLPAWPKTRPAARAALAVSVPSARVAVQARRRRPRPARMPRAA